MSDLERARENISEIDKKMVRLFEQRMDAVRCVAEYKAAHGIPVEDKRREEYLLNDNTTLIANPNYRSYYASFLRSVFALSKDFQCHIMDHRNGISVTTSQGSYEILLQRGGIHGVGTYWPLNRKVLIVTDSGVPESYAMTVASQCEEAVVFVLEQGEGSKNIDTYTGILKSLTENTFTRSDCIVAVGGGVVGDLAGFAAATYMRGIDFYNIPTTLLAQVDSAVGGKTAIDFDGYKNQMGAFYPPSGVMIDSQLLQTLPDRQIANGMAEIIKMATACDADLFEHLERVSPADVNLDDIIRRSILIKKAIVESDEHESGVRKVLNFGHTIGHAIESVMAPMLLHGECVAIGMLSMCDPAVSERLEALLQKWDLPTVFPCKYERVRSAYRHDKKADGDTITYVYVPRVGQFELRSMSIDAFEDWLEEVWQR